MLAPERSLCTYRSYIFFSQPFIILIENGGGQPQFLSCISHPLLFYYITRVGTLEGFIDMRQMVIICYPCKSNRRGPKRDEQVIRMIDGPFLFLIHPGISSSLFTLNIYDDERDSYLFLWCVYPSRPANEFDDRECLLTISAKRGASMWKEYPKSCASIGYRTTGDSTRERGDLYAPAVLIFPLLSDLSDLSVRANKKGKNKKDSQGHTPRWLPLHLIIICKKKKKKDPVRIFKDPAGFFFFLIIRGSSKLSEFLPVLLYLATR